MRRIGNKAGGRRGLSILEVLVALAILTAGMLMIMAIYPTTLRAQRDAELTSEAIALAQMKAEQIRLNDSADGKLVNEIAGMQGTEPSAPVVFPNEPRLTYSFWNKTMMFQDLADTTDTRALDGVARVIIRYAPEFRSSQDVVYELRFK